MRATSVMAGLDPAIRRRTSLDWVMAGSGSAMTNGGLMTMGGAAVVSWIGTKR